MKVDVLGQPTIVIASASLAKALLVKRANITSDRPRQVMADESVTCPSLPLTLLLIRTLHYARRLITRKMNPALTRTNYGDNMRKQRRVLNEQLRAEMVRTVGQDVERQECKALLRGKRRCRGWTLFFWNLMFSNSPQAS